MKLLKDELWVVESSGFGLDTSMSGEELYTTAEEATVVRDALAKQYPGLTYTVCTLAEHMSTVRSDSYDRGRNSASDF